MRDMDSSTAASAFSNVLTPFSGGHHLVIDTFFDVPASVWLCWPTMSSKNCSEVLELQTRRTLQALQCISNLTSIPVMICHVKSV